MGFKYYLQRVTIGLRYTKDTYRSKVSKKWSKASKTYLLFLLSNMYLVVYCKVSKGYIVVQGTQNVSSGPGWGGGGEETHRQTRQHHDSALA